MTIPLTLFVLSLLSIITLIVHKRLELAHGKGLIIVDAISDFDDKVTHAEEKIKNYASHVTMENSSRIFHSALLFSIRIVLAVVEWIRVRVHQLHEKVQYKKPKIDATNASSSVYLKQIGDPSAAAETKDDKSV